MRGFDANKNKVLDEDERTRLIAYIQVVMTSVYGAQFPLRPGFYSKT